MPEDHRRELVLDLFVMVLEQMFGGGFVVFLVSTVVRFGRLCYFFIGALGDILCMIVSLFMLAWLINIYKLSFINQKLYTHNPYQDN